MTDKPPDVLYDIAMFTHHVLIGFNSDVFCVGHDVRLPRGCDVLVRTPRGVEVGRVVSQGDDGQPSRLRIVRPIDERDRQLIGRLLKHKTSAVLQCQHLLRENGSKVQLLDVDQLLDGGTLILHFLGQPDAIDRELTDAVVARYESEVRTIELSELMIQGCGEGCGTSASGCGGGGGCSSCAVGCAVRAKP